MERREFLIGCAAGATCAADSAWAAPAEDAKPRLYRRARLVDGRGSPIRAADLPVKRNLLFHYPFVSTPAFLLNLGKPTRDGSALSTASNERYRWRGGVGPARSVVAFSAICAHQLAYPTREISFISFRDAAGPANKRAEVIHCCAEHSQYDPSEGARVVAGPAPQPLAAILLEHDEASGELFAVGTQGGEMFDAFFAKYQLRLSLEHSGRARDEVAGACVVQPLEDFCRQQVRC